MLSKCHRYFHRACSKNCSLCIGSLCVLHKQTLINTHSSTRTSNAMKHYIRLLSINVENKTIKVHINLVSSKNKKGLVVQWLSHKLLSKLFISKVKHNSYELFLILFLKLKKNWTRNSNIKTRKLTLLGLLILHWHIIPIPALF